MHTTLRAYIDLTRLQFSFAWPVLFCSGYMLAITPGNLFSWGYLAVVALIGFFGFEAGMVLNDYVDREYDRRDTEPDKLTRYWRVFGTRPVAGGVLPARSALILFLLFMGIATLLILTLP
ncbi:MAG: UbiA family prenyltransferase, partial [Methanoregulaceae archaeon]|nr:UbiA family prenyltransferase [Methanoregulaceae archaeon]